jgi:excisionase family DNA binding protein
MKYTLQQIINGFTNQPANPTWLTVKDVCRYTKLSPSTIFRATQRGVLKVSKKTGKNLFRREWIDNFLDAE